MARSEIYCGTVLTVKQAQTLHRITDVVEWRELSEYTKGNLLKLGVTKTDFNTLMWQLFDKTWVVE